MSPYKYTLAWLSDAQMDVISCALSLYRNDKRDNGQLDARYNIAGALLDRIESGRDDE